MRTGPLPICKLPFSGDKRGVTDNDAETSVMALKFPGSAIKRNAEIAGARLFGSVLLCVGTGAAKECEQEAEKNKSERWGRMRIPIGFLRSD